jgi:hypothetical protein
METAAAEEDPDEEERQLLLLLAEEDPSQLRQTPQQHQQRVQELQGIGRKLSKLEARVKKIHLQGPSMQQQQLALHRLKEQLQQSQEQLQELCEDLEFHHRQQQQQDAQRLPGERQALHRLQEFSEDDEQVMEVYAFEVCYSDDQTSLVPSGRSPAISTKPTKSQAVNTFKAALRHAKNTLEGARPSHVLPEEAAHDAYKRCIIRFIEQRAREGSCQIAPVLQAAAGTAAALAQYMQWKSKDTQHHLNFVKRLLFKTPDMPISKDMFAPELRWSNSRMRQACRGATHAQWAEDEHLMHLMDVSMLQPFILWDGQKLRRDEANEGSTAVSLPCVCVWDVTSARLNTFLCLQHTAMSCCSAKKLVVLMHF